MSDFPYQVDVNIQFADELSVAVIESLSDLAMTQWARISFNAAQEFDAILKFSIDYECVIRFVGEDESQQLNHAYRTKDKPTNVLSFTYDDLDNYLGDLVICLPVVEREASEQGKTVKNHMAHMIVHGVLHLLGYDHENETEAEVMEALECTILAKLGIDNPYEPL